MLGVIVMLLPLNLIPGLGPEIRPAGEGYGPPTDYTTRASTNECPDEKYRGLSGTEQPKDIEIEGIDGIGVFPSSLLHVGLISVVSLLFALGVYAFFKRHMIA